MTVYEQLKNFKRKYPITLAFRIKSHSKILEKHIDKDETIKYAFVGQKNDKNFELPNTFGIILTDKRLLLGRKRLFFGYFFYAITPDLLNDVTVKAGILWGKIIIDTVKEVITISNISRNALDEVETAVTDYMFEDNKKSCKKQRLVKNEN